MAGHDQRRVPGDCCPAETQMWKFLKIYSKRIGFVLLNVWLVFHVFAIFISPAGMPPASPLLVDAARVAMPYNQLLFLNHGYHYFAPDPGPSTLIGYSIERPDDIPIRGRFPDTSTFPRLMYHRYFMLAENIRAFSPEVQDEVLVGYARHFAKLHGADRITLSYISHQPSSIARMQAGGELSDPETYFEEVIGTYDFSQTTVLTPQPKSVSTDEL